MSCEVVQITKAYSSDTRLVLRTPFAPIPPLTTLTYGTDNIFIWHGIGENVFPYNPPIAPPVVVENIPAPIFMPADEKSRNFPQIIAFQVEVVRKPIQA